MHKKRLALRQTNSPGSPGPQIVPEGVKVSMAMPSRRHWISPLNTGRAEHIPAKSEQMSVPPMEAVIHVRSISEKNTFGHLL